MLKNEDILVVLAFCIVE